MAPTHELLDVELCRVSKRFGSTAAVDDLSLTIPKGGFFSLLGPSGCGKTTTLRMIAGFEEPTSGDILIGSTPVGSVPPYLRPVNTVFQSYALFPHLDVFENVAFGLRRRNVRIEEIRQRVGEALDMVNLAGLERRRIAQLSGGQQQRVALARALINRPAVLLLDEPLAALDPKLRKAMQTELKRLQREVGITFVMVTHDQEEALTMSDQIAVMHQGRLEQLGTPRAIYESPGTHFVADFIGLANFLRGRVVAQDRVRLRQGPTFPIATGAAAAEAEVEIVLRPEAVRLLSDGESAEVELAGTLTDTVYMGSQAHYHVDVGEGSRVVISAPAGLSPESACRLGWRSEDARLLLIEPGTKTAAS
ncbi:MAG TPA: ABC transporter ATP-binding protein [Candidatus Xenobia bacterium]